MRIRALFNLSKEWLGPLYYMWWVGGLAVSVVSSIKVGNLGKVAGWSWIFVVLIGVGAFVVVLILAAALIAGVFWFFTWRLIPLRKVAIKAYEKVQGTAMGGVAEEQGKTADGIIDFLANNMMSAVAVYAKRLPSTTFILVNPENMQTLRSIDGANNLLDLTNHAIIYRSPRMRRKDIKTAIGFIEYLGKPI